MILNGYIPLLTMSVQNSVFLYDSIVHPYYKGGSGSYEVSNSIGIIIYYIVPMCNAYTCTYTVYTQYDSVYAMYVHTMYMDGENKVVSAGLGDSVGDSVGDYAPGYAPGCAIDIFMCWC